MSASLLREAGQKIRDDVAAGRSREPWHPAAALAVADWLEVVLDDFDADAERTNDDYGGAFDLTEYETGWFAHHPALAVAHAYLGVQP